MWQMHLGQHRAEPDFVGPPVKEAEDKDDTIMSRELAKRRDIRRISSLRGTKIAVSADGILHELTMDAKVLTTFVADVISLFPRQTVLEVTCT